MSTTARESREKKPTSTAPKLLITPDEQPPPAPVKPPLPSRDRRWQRVASDHLDGLCWAATGSQAQLEAIERLMADAGAKGEDRRDLRVWRNEAENAVSSAKNLIAAALFVTKGIGICSGDAFEPFAVKTREWGQGYTIVISPGLNDDSEPAYERDQVEILILGPDDVLDLGEDDEEGGSR